MDEKVEILYHNFWRPLVEDSSGTIVEEKVANELYDYRTLMINANKVYIELADLGNIFASPHEIINKARENFTREFCLDLLEAAGAQDDSGVMSQVVLDFVFDFVNEKDDGAVEEYRSEAQFRENKKQEMVDISPEAEGGNE